VSYQGQPLANAQVLFSPADGGLVASGTTDAAGRYRLGTFETTDGALIGKHRVAIVARGPGKPEADAGTGLPGGALLPGDPLIPEKYFSAETSGLEKEVVAGGNTFDFSLQ
jgi:hypothetical protein